MTFEGESKSKTSFLGLGAPGAPGWRRLGDLDLDLGRGEAEVEQSEIREAALCLVCDR